MNRKVSQQIVISGVGGQGVLFVTRLLAEAAIARGLSVLTSETHGMAQRGGSVVSHLKVGDFSSPLIRSGRADGLLGLKAESLDLHGHFVRIGGWRIINSPGGSSDVAHVDADTLATRLENHRAVNLVVLGFALARLDDFFCSCEDMARILDSRLTERPAMREASRRALDAGYEAGNG